MILHGNAKDIGLAVLDFLGLDATQKVFDLEIDKGDASAVVVRATSPVQKWSAVKYSEKGSTKLKPMSEAEREAFKAAFSQPVRTVDIGVGQWVWTSDSVPTGWRVCEPTIEVPGKPVRSVESIQYTDPETGNDITVKVPEGQSVVFNESGWSIVKTTPPCTDCNGTGEYRGLNAVEPCMTCRKAVQ